jgi:hypothetical protein
MVRFDCRGAKEFLGFFLADASLNLLLVASNGICERYGESDCESRGVPLADLTANHVGGSFKLRPTILL